MARKKSQPTPETPEKEEVSQPKPPDMSPQEIVYMIFDETFGRCDRGIPMLLGESNYGKTWTVEKYAQDRGCEVDYLYLQTQEPETIQGYDVKVEGPDGKTTLEEMPPGWLRRIWRALEQRPEGKHILFVDEADKPRDQVQAAGLSLLGSRRIKNWVLPKNVGIIAAGNPSIVPLRPEWMSRLLPISFPFAESQLLDGFTKIRSLMSEYLTMPKDDWGTFDRKKNKGIGHRLESWFDVPAFWKSESFRNIILKGLLPHKDIPWWQSRLDPKTFLSMDLMAWVRDATPADIRDMLLPVFEACQDENMRFNAMGELCKRATSDPTGEISQAFIAIAGKVHDGIPPIKKA